jgi:hypothetical protein
MEMTLAEAAEFWDTHSVADFPSRRVAIVYSPDERLSFVAVASDLLQIMERKAKERGVSVETLLNLGVQEKLSA